MRFNFNDLVGRAMARTSRLRVDSIVATLDQQRLALEHTADALRARAARRYRKGEAILASGDLDAAEAARADRVSQRIAEWTA